MSQTQSILAIETSTAACSAALLHQGQTFFRLEIVPQKHAHRLLEMVDELMAEAGIQGEDLDLLAYGEGPGAFTGVRVSAGVIQGLALGWDKPVVGISSLEAMAESAMQTVIDVPLDQAKPVSWCAMMDARMGEVYLLSGVFTPKTDEWKLSETELLSPELAQERIAALDSVQIGIGDIHNEYPDLLKRFDRWIEQMPSALSVAHIALRNVLKGEADAAGAKTEEKVPLPVYLRNHVADTIDERKLKAAQKGVS